MPLLLTLLSTSVGTLLQTLRDQVVIDSISLTFKAGALATILGLLLGGSDRLPACPFRLPWKSHHRGGDHRLPTVIPRTAAGIALLLVFGRTGILGKAFAHLGITFTDRLAGIVVAMLFVSVPLLVNTSRQAFQAVNRDLEQAAQVDGASAWKVWQISLPLAWRGVLNGAIMMFARGISEFGAVIILAYSPKIVPVLIYERFQGYGLEAATPQ